MPNFRRGGINMRSEGGVILPGKGGDWGDRLGQTRFVQRSSSLSEQKGAAKVLCSDTGKGRRSDRRQERCHGKQGAVNKSLPLQVVQGETGISARVRGGRYRAGRMEQREKGSSIPKKKPQLKFIITSNS